MFRILGDPIIKQIPWDAIAPHEHQAILNHSQSLRRLDERGGLGVYEAFWVMAGRALPTGFKGSDAIAAAYRLELMRMLWKHEKTRSGEPAA